MDKDHIKRMYVEAHDRIHDAEILSRNATTKSDSASQLKILGFEILLKCAIFTCNLIPKNSHNYKKLWQALPGYAKKDILYSAKLRMGGHTDFSDLDNLLLNYQFVFEKARYFYELYEGYTLEEQREIGKFWEEIGAPINKADVQYYPLELDSLIHGLSEYIKDNVF